MIKRGDICWADFGEPRGSEPAKRRPVVIMQEDWLLASNINTVLVVPLTSNVGNARFPGNVLVPSLAGNLDRDSVALVSQLGPISREYIEPYAIGRLPSYLMQEIVNGIKLLIGA